ncbi:MAG TPA: M1 family metallopeptidase [Ginsengibacter sp.]|nr:M1 family metallopeptidase [Ginsengibacter sp.]
MKKFLIIFSFAVLFFDFADCQSLNETKYSAGNYFQQKTDYKIDVTLNDVDNTLDGFEIINYTNNSPDTLRFIWFHLWPNAYKNDRTAFSEQLLQLGRTDFYFSDNEKRGYINRLDFKVDGVTAQLEDHPQYIDISKLILPTPLAPGQTIKITTPFHEKIPFNFSRGGYVGHTYQITQWYPKPAVYDAKGWHPIPYLDQGEFYSEFGNYDVQITIPKDYVVAATGELQNADELNFLKEKESESILPKPKQKVAVIKEISNQNNKTKKNTSSKTKSKTPIKKADYHIPAKSNSPIKQINKNSFYITATQKEETKTINYIQNNVHDFAWFADRNFIVNHDILKLASGKIINVYAYYTPAGKNTWKNSIQFIKDAVTARSKWLGEYPYNVVSAVEAKMGFNGGMEYPTITSISPSPDEKSLDLTIEHEVGHNWNYGILASNERDHPWMDEGMNTYFDNRYKKMKYSDATIQKNKQDFINNKLPEDETDLEYRTEITNKRDQPIETTSENFSELNYGLTAYYKTGKWMKVLEDYVGEPLFDSCLHEYYNRWKFKHPQPEDFKKVVEDVSNKNVDSIFLMLHQKGSIEPEQKKDLKFSVLFNFNETDKHNYIFLSPAAGFNYYDKFMVGALVHNYTLPEPTFHFIAAPMYATGSSTFTGIGKIGYNILSYGFIRKTELSLSAAKFTGDVFTDSTGTKNYLGFSKIVPSLKIIFKNRNATSSITKSIQWKTYFIKETGLLFSRDTINQRDVISYPKLNRYLNQLQLKIENNRVLYPYSGLLQAEQAKDFVRLSFEGKYFFNYAKGGGMNVRIFGGKFIYLGDKTILKEFETDRYHLNMTGANGYEDYTYSNYFAGRNEFRGFRSQQIMIRDGGFKVRSDLLANKIGKTDDWLAAANFETDFPKKFNPLQVLPVKIPLKLFFDAGTYAEAWKTNAPTGKFIYDAGLQVSLLKNLINIYVPVIYSKIYADYLKSTITDKRFWKNISFSIDIQNFRFYKFFDLPQL